jgi:hypothetical protein
VAAGLTNYVDGATNGLASVTYVDAQDSTVAASLTNYVDSATNGLASVAYVDAQDTGVATAATNYTDAATNAIPTPTLQEVTDSGSTTTTDVTMAGIAANHISVGGATYGTGPALAMGSGANALGINAASFGESHDNNARSSLLWGRAGFMSVSARWSLAGGFGANVGSGVDAGISLGYLPTNTHDRAYVWSGQIDGSASKGTGTFSIDPVGGTSGFYIGSLSLAGILGDYLPLAGGTMSGSIDMGDNDLFNAASVGISGLSPFLSISDDTPDAAFTTYGVDDTEIYVNAFSSTVIPYPFPSGRAITIYADDGYIEFGGDLDISGNSVTNIGRTDFGTNYTVTGNEAIGATYWDADNNTLSTRLTDEVIYQHGEELMGDFDNNTGSTITNGTPVMFAGSVGASGLLRAQPAIADGSIPASYIIGLATEDIPNGETGKVSVYGSVRGIDTTGTPYGETWLAGDVIYVSPTTAGALTKVQPNAPDLTISIGAVSVVNANVGVIGVRPDYGCKLVDLDDVNGTPLLTNGQFVVWDNDNQYFDANYNINDYPTYAASTNLVLDVTPWKEDAAGDISYTATNPAGPSVTIGGPSMDADAIQLAVTNANNGTILRINECGDFLMATGSRIGIDETPSVLFIDSSSMAVRNNSGRNAIYITRDVLINQGGWTNLDFIVASGADSEAIFVNSATDKVGISTRTPEAKLHVAGTMQVDNYLAEMDFTEDGTQQFTAAGFSVITNFIDNIVDAGFTTTHSNITVTTAGRYKAGMALSFRSNTGATEVECYLYTNGVAAVTYGGNEIGWDRSVSVSSSDGTVAAYKTLDLPANCIVDWRIQLNGTDTLQWDHGTISVERR